jgi:hypothetical protein
VKFSATSWQKPEIMSIHLIPSNGHQINGYQNMSALKQNNDVQINIKRKLQYHSIYCGSPVSLFLQRNVVSLGRATVMEILLHTKPTSNRNFQNLLLL